MLNDIFFQPDTSDLSPSSKQIKRTIVNVQADGDDYDFEEFF